MKWEIYIILTTSDGDNHITLDNSNVSDEKWDFVADHLNFDGRLFSKPIKNQTLTTDFF